MRRLLEGKCCQHPRTLLDGAEGQTMRISSSGGLCQKFFIEKRSKVPKKETVVLGIRKLV